MLYLYLHETCMWHPFKFHHMFCGAVWVNAWEFTCRSWELNSNCVICWRPYVAILRECSISLNHMESTIWMDTPSSQAGAYLSYSLIYFCCGANSPFQLADVGGSFPGNEADHTTPFGAEYKNAWGYSTTSRYSIMACTQEKYGGNYCVLRPSVYFDIERAVPPSHTRYS